MNINFGGGEKKVEGYQTFDINPDYNPHIIGDLNKIPYQSIKTASVDNVLLDNVLEHLWIELPTFVIEMRRILKPDGKLRIISPNCFWWKNRISYLLGRFRERNGWHINHSFILKPTEMKRYLEINGFSVTLNKGKSIWERLSWINKNLFIQSVDIEARKRP